METLFVFVIDQIVSIPNIPDVISPSIVSTGTNYTWIYSQMSVQDKIIHLQFYSMEKQKIIIITGKKGSGKTTLAYEYIEVLKKKGVKIGGIITRSDDTKRYGKKLSYSVVDIVSNEERELLTSVKIFDKSMKVGRFYINQEGMSWAKKKIVAALEKCRAVMIDELGPAELQGFGYAGIAKELINGYKGLIIFIVRIELLEQMCLYLQCDPEITLVVDVENRNNKNNQVIYKVLVNE